jgi:hypothetical protein
MHACISAPGKLQGSRELKGAYHVNYPFTM